MRAKPAAVRWMKEWVPQELISSGGKCSLLKWVTEDMLKSLNEKLKESENYEPEPEPEAEPTTEVLFLCNYEGCGKTFLDVGALRKHALTHGEKQHVCHYDGCGKKFLDSSKLKRHFLTHTGERHFICPHPGCDCDKKYTQENKLLAHIRVHHGKNAGMDTVKHSMPVAGKPQSTPKIPSSVYGSTSSDRPYVCPYGSCDKAYIHEYKLNLHLKKEHPGQNSEENGKHHTPAADHDLDEASEQDTLMKKFNDLRSVKRNRPSPVEQMPPSKISKHKGSTFVPTNMGAANKPCPIKDMYEEDSEETEEDRDDAENDDDEETEDED